MVNTEAVIVALPPALDSIRLAGDEEKHATILYFGETASLPDEAKTTILESLATAANMFMPFAEETMGTERLGADVPPALVTKLTGRCLSKIRDALQINPAIVTYMGNATQHPAYLPHVTLGYPDWQGEADLKKLMTALYEVRFDRIALWWNDERFEFDLGAKDRGMARAMNEVSHDAQLKVDAFLEHVGVKGMKWGIRRNRDSGGDGGSSKADAKSDKKAQKDMDKMPSGSVVPVKNPDGSTKLLLKKKDGSWHETYVSVDAEKFIRAREKAGHEMSDRELKETMNRANMVENYNKLFGTGDHADLKRQVEELQLKKSYKDLQAELNPPRKSMVKKFIKGSESAFDAYQRIDSKTGGALSGHISKQFAAAKASSGGNSKAAKKFAAGQKPQSTPGPKVKGFRGKTPPIPWGSSPPKSPSFTSPGGVKINQNPFFKPKTSSSGQVFNISDIGKTYNPSTDYPNPFTPRIGTRGGT